MQSLAHVNRYMPVPIADGPDIPPPFSPQRHTVRDELLLSVFSHAFALCARRELPINQVGSMFFFAEDVDDLRHCYLLPGSHGNRHFAVRCIARSETDFMWIGSILLHLQLVDLTYVFKHTSLLAGLVGLAHSDSKTAAVRALHNTPLGVLEVPCAWQTPEECFLDFDESTPYELEISYSSSNATP